MDDSKRPLDSAFKQQRLEDWRLKLNINGLVGVYFVVAILFLPLGVLLRAESNSVAEYRIQYDGPNPDVSGCSVQKSNTYSTCPVSITFLEDVTGPIFVYYQIEHFYQNHRRYVKSKSAGQLLGAVLTHDEVASDCYPIVANGSSLLHPCGLIANTFFNDVISLGPTATAAGLELDTDGISWPFDSQAKFRQVEGFVAKEVADFSQTCAAVLGNDEYADCKRYTEPDGTRYYYWYPQDDVVQYLHETFPTVSPIRGVTDEHFVNWMRTAGLPSFRKLYGKVDADFRKGDSLAFDLTLNFEVRSYGGSKSLVVTNLSPAVGGKSTALGNTYIVVGSLSLAIGTILALKRLIKPRPLGDIRELEWSSY